MYTKSLKVHELDELEEITSFSHILDRPITIELQIEGLQEPNRQNWQALINKHLSKCGCAEGSVFMILTVFVYIIYLLSLPDMISLTVWDAIWQGAGTSLIAALVGKSFGLARTQRNLSKLLSRLRESYSSNKGKFKLTL